MHIYIHIHLHNYRYTYVCGFVFVGCIIQKNIIKFLQYDKQTYQSNLLCCDSNFSLV